MAVKFRNPFCSNAVERFARDRREYNHEYISLGITIERKRKKRKKIKIKKVLRIKIEKEIVRVVMGKIQALSFPDPSKYFLERQQKSLQGRSLAWVRQ